MKTRHKISAVLIIFISIAVYFSGCDFGQLKQRSVIGTSIIAVDENFVPLMKELKAEFERLNPEGKIDYTENPTKVAANDFVNRKYKTVILPRELTKEEADFAKEVKLEYKKYEIATDAIGFIVNPKSPIERLTSVDLEKIFTGNYKKWSEVKMESPNEDQNEKAAKLLTGAANTIKVYIQRPNSSTYDFVKDSVMGGAEYSKTAVICATSSEILDSVRKNLNAIGIINLSWVSTSNQDVQDSTVKPVRISLIKKSGIQKDFSIFHQGTAAYGTYPYIRLAYLYTSEADINVITGFITFVLGNDGQKVVLKNNLGPLKQPIRYIKIE